MKRSEIIRRISGLMAGLTLSFSAFSALACNTVTLETKNLRGTEIELYEFVGTKIERSKSLPDVKKSALGDKVIVEDCGDPKYYLWSYENKEYLFRKSLFVCLSSPGSKDGDARSAGAPGSGTTNLSCPTS